MCLNVTFVHAWPSPAKLYLDIFYKLVRSPGENGGGQDAQKDLTLKNWKGREGGEDPRKDGKRK